MRQSPIRYLRGERPGMRAGLPETDIERGLTAVLYPDLHFFTSLLVQTSVQLADVSFWQEDIDFARMKAEAIAGVIIRAGQRNWADSRFMTNWRNARAAGLPRGSYFFYDSREDPKKQAELWWSLVQDDYGELLHVADFEESYGGPYGTRDHLRIFLARFQELSHFPDDRIGIYTGFYWWMARVGADPYFKRFALWIASYTAMSLVRIPAPWEENDVLFWQYTSSGDGPRYGVSSQEIDLNWYCCSLAHFTSRFRLSVSPPPTNGGTMEYYEIRSNSTSSRSIRSGPNVRHPKLAINGDLFAGRIAKAGTTTDDVYTYLANVPDGTMPTGFAALAGDTWRKVFEVDGRAVIGWIAKIHLGQTMIEETLRGSPAPEPEPQPTLPDLPVTIVLGDDVAYEKQTITTTLKRKQ